MVKIQLYWGDVAPAGRRKPAGFDAADPSSYHWNTYPGAVNAIIAAGMRPYLSIGAHAPRWATNGSGRPGTGRPSAKEFGLFAQAVGRQFPNVHIWSMWNEPNLYSWLSPQRTRGVPQSPSIYRKLYLAGHAGLSATGHGGDRILLGELMPRGGTSSKKIRPLVFLRELVCLDSNYRQYRGRAARARGCGKVGRIPTSGLAYHPYTLRGGPAIHDGPGDAAIGELSRVTKVLDALGRRGKLPRKLPLWITEFGYQTSPPDPIFGVRLKRAAAFMDTSEFIAFRDPRIASYSQYTLKDEPPRSDGRPFSRWSTWQSGLRFGNGRPKPYVYGRVPPARSSCARSARTWSSCSAAGAPAPGRSPRLRRRLRAAVTVRSRPSPSTSSGYFRQIVRLKKAYRHTFRLRLGGLTRIKRPTVVL